MNDTLNKEDPISEEDHIKVHKELHAHLDILVADYMKCSDNYELSCTSIMDIMKWSHQQTIKPDKIKSP